MAADATVYRKPFSLEISFGFPSPVFIIKSSRFGKQTLSNCLLTGFEDFVLFVNGHARYKPFSRQRVTAKRTRSIFHSHISLFPYSIKTKISPNIYTFSTYTKYLINPAAKYIPIPTINFYFRSCICNCFPTRIPSKVLFAISRVAFEVNTLFSIDQTSAEESFLDF